MTWYSAHCIVTVVFRDNRNQTEWPLWENIVLIQADTDELALKKAIDFGKRGAVEDESFTHDSRPAYLKFAGVRKLIRCDGDVISDGVEVTYNEMSVSGNTRLDAFLRGDPVAVDDFE